MKRMDPREIQHLEELCIQDDAPFCQAACPLHVDVRGMLAAVARGNFDLGAATYSKRVPLPGVLSRICDQPCRLVCRRADAGDPLNVQLLERSLADYCGFAEEPPKHGLSKQQRIAIVGGGLSGLSAAHQLAERHYTVTVFETADRVGGRLRSFPAEVLPPEIVDEEVARLKRLGVDFRTATEVERHISLAELLEQYDAVYVGIGAPPPGASEPEVSLDKTGTISFGATLGDVDPVTLATAQKAVFAGGSLLRPAEPYSPVSSASDGCRAAVSIDRFLKGESLTSHRENEGPYRTRLHTSVQGIEPAGAVAPAGPGMSYSREEAVGEAERCMQCQCLECVKACTYLDHFDEYPGKCIRKVTKNIISLPGKSYRTHTKVLNACSLCGLCGVVCPTDLDMSVVNSQARRVMWEKGFMPPAIHDFAIRDMESSSTGPYAVTRNQPGFDSSSYLFFPGCQLAASTPHHVERIYRFLAEKLSGGVGLMMRCCGAPAAWSGRLELFEEMLDGFTAQWTALGQPQVVIACPTCTLMFRENLSHIPCLSLWEVLDREGLPAGAPSGAGRPLAVHDSCTARWAREIQDSVRSIVGKLGYEVEELPYSREMTKCCGYGGLMYLVNQGLTAKVIESRVGESPTAYVTYCSNCRDLFADRGKASYHVFDLLFDGYADDATTRPGPTRSQRRDNRRRLAAELLTELWGEAMPEQDGYMRVQLIVPEDVAAKMEKDFILTDDVKQVIYHAETTGNKLQVPATGRFIAHYQPSIVTYWVEYAPEGDEYRVFNVYSHRMQIVEEVSRNES